MEYLNTVTSQLFARKVAARFEYDGQLTESQRLRHLPPYDTIDLTEHFRARVLDITDYSYSNLGWAYVNDSSFMIDNYGRRWAYPLPGAQPQQRVDEWHYGGYYFEQPHQEGPWVDAEGHLQTGWDAERRALHASALWDREVPRNPNVEYRVHGNLDRMARQRVAHRAALVNQRGGHPPPRLPRLLRYRPRPVHLVQPNVQPNVQRPPRDNDDN